MFTAVKTLLCNSLILVSYLLPCIPSFKNGLVMAVLVLLTAVKKNNLDLFLTSFMQNFEFLALKMTELWIFKFFDSCYKLSTAVKKLLGTSLMFVWSYVAFLFLFSSSVCV